MFSDGGQSGLQQERGIIKMGRMIERSAQYFKSVIIYGVRTARSLAQNRKITAMRLFNM